MKSNAFNSKGAKKAPKKISDIMKSVGREVNGIFAHTGSVRSYQTYGR